MGITVKREDSIRNRVIDYGISILSSRNAAEDLECVEVEHDDRSILTRSGKTVTGMFNHRDPVRTIDACDFTEQLAIIFVHHHHTVLATDENPVVWGVGDDIV